MPTRPVKVYDLGKVVLDKFYRAGWEDCLISQPPSIPVSEISRLLILLKKYYRNHRMDIKPGVFTCLDVLHDVRITLELRRRSRSQLRKEKNVQKNLRSIRKMDSAAAQSKSCVRYVRGSACKSQDGHSSSTKRNRK